MLIWYSLIYALLFIGFNYLIVWGAVQKATIYKDIEGK